MDTLARTKSHPGIILKDVFLKPLQISIEDLAAKACITEYYIKHLISGEFTISVGVAMKLAKYFGNTPKFWLNLQINYDLSVVENNKNFMMEIKSIVPYEQEKKK